MKKQRVHDVVSSESGRDLRGEKRDSVDGETDDEDVRRRNGESGDDGRERESSILDENKSRIFQALRQHQQVSSAGAASRLARPRRWKYKETLGKVGTLLNDPKSAPVSRESSLAKHRVYQSSSRATIGRTRNDSQTSNSSNSGSGGGSKQRSSSRVRFNVEARGDSSGRPLPWN